MVSDISDKVIGQQGEQQGVKTLRSVKINYATMDFYARREEGREQGESSIIQSYHMIQAVDPDLKKTAHAIRQFYRPDDDL